MKDYMVRITAGGETRWIGDDLDTPFVDNEGDAAVFQNHEFVDFQKWVYREVEGMEFRDGKTFNEIGLENIEFVFVKGE